MNDRSDIFLFDAHCHIAPTWGCDADDALGNGEAAGRLLCGVGVFDWDRVARAAEIWPGTRTAFGVHPWQAGSMGEGGEVLEDLERRLARDRACWVGEIGLDGMRTDEADESAQESAFNRQLRLAARLGRRVNLHCVRAWESLVKGLDESYLAQGGREGFIVHSFAGPHQYVEALRRRGAYFTIGPLAWRRGSRRQAERVRLLPEDRLLLESDAFLTPKQDAGDALRDTLAWLAGVRGVGVRDLAGMAADNARRLFTDE